MKLPLKSIRVKSKGFTLIEVLVALVVLSITLLGIASLMATTNRYNASGGHLTQAVTLAQDKLEELRISPWANIITGNDTIPGSTETNGIQYTRNWSVSPNVAPPDDTLRTVNITVNWNDGVDHSVNILSAIAK